MFLIAKSYDKFKWKFTHVLFFKKYHDKVSVVNNIFVYQHILYLASCETGIVFNLYKETCKQHTFNLYDLTSAYYDVESCKETHAKHGTK